jgi:hypothetical protein
VTNKLRQHMWLLRALGKNYCKKFRSPSAILRRLRHGKDVFLVRDYTDRVQCSYTNSTQSGEMGGSAKNIGMEGFLYTYLNELTDKIENHWLGYLSDWKQQDARTSYANTDKFIQRMRAIGKLPEGATLWIQSDGCGK